MQHQVEPYSYSHRQLLAEASLNTHDLQEVRHCRRGYNRLGFAYQIGFIRLLNRLPTQRPLEIIPELLTFIALQVGIDSEKIHQYAARQHTVSDHQTRIRSYLCLHTLKRKELCALVAFLLEESFRLEQPAALLTLAKVFLKERHILQPADSALLRLVGEQRSRAREEIFAKVTTTLPQPLLAVLDQLLEVHTNQTVSTLQLIKANPNKPSAPAMLALLAKLHAIEATKALNVDLTWLNGNYQRALFHSVKKCSVDRLKTAAPPRRHASMVCFLWQSYRDTVDQMIDMFDKLITRTQRQAQQERDRQMLQQRQMIYASLDTFKRIEKVILDPSIADAHLREYLFDEVPQEHLESQVTALDQWVSGQGPDVFEGVMKRYSSLRQFTPHLLRAVEFLQETDGEPTPCLEALALLKQLNADHKRKLPDDASLDFVPPRRLPLMRKEGKLDRRAWECALLITLRDEIKAGNI